MKILKLLILALFFVQAYGQSNETNSKKINFYENNDKYFIKNIDVNKDGLKDKIVSSQKNQGEELLVFINKKNEYIFTFETTNFSEDGGNQISDIKEDKNGFIIITYFPDRGYYEKEYYIKNIKENWLLDKIVFKTSSLTEYTKIDICTVVQNINLKDDNFSEKIQDIPEENNRKKLCKIDYLFEENDVRAYLLRFKDKNFNNVKDVERYKSMLMKFPLTLKNSPEYNDIAYYLEQSKSYNEAIFLLEEILDKFPNRTVAWLNLADSQFGIKDKLNAKKSYEKYIELLKSHNKDLKKIPKRVYNRSN